MRLEAGKCRGDEYDIYFEDWPQTDVVLADDETGELVKLARDRDGNYLHDGDKVLLVTHRGKVEFVER